MKTTRLSHEDSNFLPPTILEYAQASPAICGSGSELCVAWVDPDGDTLRVTHGGALTPDGFRSDGALPATVLAGVRPRVGIAIYSDAYHVAFCVQGGVGLARSVDGRAWTFLVTHPGAHATGGVSLVVHDGLLFVSWREDATGVAMIMSWNGSAFSALESLRVKTECVPALASLDDPLQQALHIAVASDVGEILASRCYQRNVGDLARGFRPVPGLTGEAVTMTAIRADRKAALAVGVISRRRSSICTATVIAEAPFFKVERSDLLGEQGVDLPNLTTVDNELFLGYRKQSNEIEVACYVHACKSDDRRVGLPCDPAVCSLDPRVVCVLTDAYAIRWQPATIENAQKGDLILTPADGHGTIGTLLRALTPPQIYDHMGMMMTDKTVIRHCTESKDRLKDKKYYTGDLVGTSAPTHGLRDDHLTWGWPGIIQQTIEDAFYTGLRGPYNAQWATPSSGRGPRTEDPTFNATIPVDPRFLAVSPDERHDGVFQEIWDSLKFEDPEEPHYTYEIQNLPKNPALQDDGQLLWPILVRPKPEYETAFPWVRPLLHRIADASLSLRAHYRFYSYTRSAIAIDGSKDPPSNGPSWWAIEKLFQEDGRNVIRPIEGVDWPVGTHPMVCSTFVWAAVRKAEEGLGRQIQLEAHGQVLNNAGKPRRPTGSLDGLHKYTAAERLDSASALHDALVREVLQTVDEDHSGIEGLGADVAVTIADLADNVATQTVNSFAVDRADEIDAALWADPGDGDAVGPDDILLNWDSPTLANVERFQGLYGENVPANIVQGAYVWGPDFRYEIAKGMAHVRVQTVYTDQTTGAVREVPAFATVGCESGHTSANASFATVIGVAKVLVKATSWDPVLGIHLKYEKEHKLNEGINDITIYLEGPPDWRRRVTWTGDLHIYHNPYVGDKQENTKPFAGTTILAYDPDVMDPAHAPLDQGRYQKIKDYMTRYVIENHSVAYDDHHVDFRFEIELLEDNAIKYNGTFTFFVDGDLQDDQTRHVDGRVEQDSFRPFTYEVSHDAVLDSHDYGRISLTIRNDWARN